MTIRLLVFRCGNIENSLAFYEMLGLAFVKEKHGKGPIHYSTNINGCVFELYPSLDKESLDGTRLGFEVQRIDDVLSQVDVLDTYVFHDRKVYVVADPDGRKVELYD